MQTVCEFLQDDCTWTGDLDNMTDRVARHVRIGRDLYIQEVLEYRSL